MRSNGWPRVAVSRQVDVSIARLGRGLTELEILPEVAEPLRVVAEKLPGAGIDLFGQQAQRVARTQAIIGPVASSSPPLAGQTVQPEAAQQEHALVAEQSVGDSSGG